MGYPCIACVLSRQAQRAREKVPARVLGLRTSWCRWARIGSAVGGRLDAPGCNASVFARTLNFSVWPPNISGMDNYQIRGGGFPFRGARPRGGGPLCCCEIQISRFAAWILAFRRRSRTICSMLYHRIANGSAALDIIELKPIEDHGSSGRSGPPRRTCRADAAKNR